MISASTAWKEKQQQLLAPETFVEITCEVTETGLQNEATATGTTEAVISNVAAITRTSNEETIKKYATLEQNLWLLDGTRNILSQNNPCPNAGYVSDNAGLGSVTLSLPAIHTVAIPGVTIMWSSEYGEYATKFTVTAKNGETVVAETTVTDNTSNRSYVYLDITNYNSVTVTVLEWSMPNHRPRIDWVYLGFSLVFDKNDIFSYTHEQSGCLLSGELPKNSVTFSVNNIDGQWNPQNPSGLERYLSERQRVTVRYGMDIDGTTEWIKAGTFYLSEWKTPSNGLEATFVARDLFEFLIGAGGIGAARYGSLSSLVDLAGAYLPEGVKVLLDPVLENYSAEYLGETTAAVSVQKCANAAMCVLRIDRDGTLNIVPLNTDSTDYAITSKLLYAYPEMELSKPLGSVAVTYKGAEEPYILTVANTGEQQTVDNNYIRTVEHAAEVANWVKNVLTFRNNVTGEFRADPRLDVFDIVQVESKYGLLPRVVITNITYHYSGAFKGSFKGLVLEDN